MVKLSIDLSIIVNKYLVSKNLRDSQIRIFDPKYTEFYEYELGQITELCITNCYDISELINFPNLKILHIKSADYNKLDPSLDYRESQVINHITNFSILSELPNLEELVIANDLYVSTIDLSNMQQLSKLILINNPNLKEVIGLDKLYKLNEVTMYGNNISGDNFDFDIYSKNTRLCVENTLDISMYLDIIKNNREYAKHLEELEVTGRAFVRFAEKSGFLNCVCLSLRDLYELFLSLDIYFKKYNAYDLTESEKIEFVHRYIMNNIKFNRDLIIDRNIAYLADKEQYDEIPNKIRKIFNNFHSSFYAHRFKEANCEGRVNLIVFMLKMLGVEATNVHCHDNQSDRIGSNHSIARIHTDGKYSYLDASIAESYSRRKLLEIATNYGIKDISKLFFCVDYDFMSNFVTLDSYEYSLYEKEKEKQKQFI